MVAENILVSVPMAVLAAVVTAVAVVAPGMGPRDRFFGVLVDDADFAASPFAKRTLRAFRVWVVAAGTAAVLALLLPLAGVAIGDLATPVFFLFTIVVGGAYVWAHGRTLEEAKKTGAGGAAAADARHWKLGIVYFNPADPRVDVPKNFGDGSTLNFAHKTSWLIVLLPIFFGALIVLVVTLVT
ncbi:MAG TPA: hypothetical protein VGD74_10110 [Vulgatibacter sp.]